MSLASPVNPFEESADPREYVPRVACEAVLESLERHLEAGVPVVVLRGPAGIGKSMLLSVLHQRVAEAWRVAQVAVSPSPSVEISHRILDLLDVDVDTDPSSTLVATARRFATSGRRVLVIIDPATHVPVASSRQLARAAARAGGDLCVLFAVTEGAGAEEFEREIGAEAGFASVRFDSPMSAQETSEYIVRRLDQTLDSETLRDRFDEAAFRYVIEGAAGRPRQVNELAYDALNRLERGDPLPARDADPEASAGLATEAPASAPGASLLQRGPSTYVDPPQPGHSLGGGLLGTGPARDPREFDATRELFPPGFLRSDRDARPPADAPAPGSEGVANARGDAGRIARDRGPGRTPERGDATPAEATAGVAAAVGGAAAVEDSSAVERAAAVEGASAAETAAEVERVVAAASAAEVERVVAAERVAAVEGAATVETAAAPASAKRAKLWVAALIVTAAAVGYLAGRVDPASNESSPPPPAVPTPVARDVRPISPEPRAPLAQPERTPLEVPAPVAAVAPSIPAAGPDETLVDSIDSVVSSDSIDTASTAAAAKPAAPPRTRVEPVPAAPSTQPTVAKAATAAGKDEQAGALPLAAAPPLAVPRVSAEQPRPTPASSIEDGQPVADDSVTAIVVGARSAGEARASAYARVRVQLEPGVILSVDGEKVGVAPLADLIMEPGLHTFVAELPDGLQIEQLIQVTPETGVVEF